MQSQYSRVVPRPFENADSNITNIFIRTWIEYFNARAAFCLFAFDSLDDALFAYYLQTWLLKTPEQRGIRDCLKSA